jgi:hypothetical protein
MNDENAIVENPFNAPQYSDMQMNDEPLPFAGNMIDSMLNNDEVPEDVKHKNWWIFHKDNVLGFLDERRKQEKLLNFDIIKLDTLATLPRKSYKFDTELNFDIMRNVFETKLDRSVGVTNASSVMNERKSLISQISENRNVSESDYSLVKESFIRKLMGKAKR